MYVGTIDGPIQVSSSSTFSNNVQQSLSILDKSSDNSTQLSLVNNSINNSLLQPNLIPSIPSQEALLNIPLQSIDDDLEEIFNISNHNSNVNKKSAREFLSNFLVDNQQNLIPKTITLLFSYDNPEELFFWAKHATIEDLLKSPAVNYINER